MVSWFSTYALFALFPILGYINTKGQCADLPSWEEGNCVRLENRAMKI